MQNAILSARFAKCKQGLSSSVPSGFELAWLAKASLHCRQTMILPAEAECHSCAQLPRLSSTSALLGPGLWPRRLRRVQRPALDNHPQLRLKLYHYPATRHRFLQTAFAFPSCQKIARFGANMPLLFCQATLSDDQTHQFPYRLATGPTSALNLEKATGRSLWPLWVLHCYDTSAGCFFKLRLLGGRVLHPLCFL